MSERTIGAQMIEGLKETCDSLEGINPVVELLVARQQLAAVTAERDRLREERDAALKVLVAYEAWEGRLVLSDEAWDGGIAEFPTLTPELYDEVMEIQTARNKVVRAARAAGILQQPLTPEAR